MSVVDPDRDLKEILYEQAEKAVAEAEIGVEFAKRKANQIMTDARHQAYLAYHKRNAAMRALGIHPDQIAKQEISNV